MLKYPNLLESAEPLRSASVPWPRYCPPRSLAASSLCWWQWCSWHFGRDTLANFWGCLAVEHATCGVWACKILNALKSSIYLILCSLMCAGVTALKALAKSDWVPLLAESVIWKGLWVGRQAVFPWHAMHHSQAHWKNRYSSPALDFASKDLHYMLQHMHG